MKHLLQLSREEFDRMGRGEGFVLRFFNGDEVTLQVDPPPALPVPLAPGAKRQARRTSYECDQCDATFTAAQALGGHMSGHRRRAIKKSVRRAKKQIGRIHCDFHCAAAGCDYGSNKKGWLLRHIEREHPGSGT